VPFPARVMTSVIAAPCVTESAVEADVMVSVGADRVTVSGSGMVTP